jgi:hypothetical protein
VKPPQLAGAQGLAHNTNDNALGLGCECMNLIRFVVSLLQLRRMWCDREENADVAEVTARQML